MADTTRAPLPFPAGELRLRVISALILAGLALAATAVGGWPFRVVWALVAGVVAYEWLRVAQLRFAVMGGVLAGLAGLAAGLFPESSPLLVAVTVLGGVVAVLLTRVVTAGAALGACGLGYALVFAVVVPALRDAAGPGLAVIVWTFAVVWVTDTAAFFTGRALGGPKLMPSVSPKKTWSGAAGGTLAGALAGLAVWAVAGRTGLPAGAGAVFVASLAASVLGQAGDLFESDFKRRFGVKDSSHLIPGHGGFMDRLDGYWAVVVFAGVLFVVATAGA